MNNNKIKTEVISSNRGGFESQNYRNTDNFSKNVFVGKGKPTNKKISVHKVGKMNKKTVEDEAFYGRNENIRGFRNLKEFEGDKPQRYNKKEDYQNIADHIGYLSELGGVYSGGMRSFKKQYIPYKGNNLYDEKQLLGFGKVGKYAIGKDNKNVDNKPTPQHLRIKQIKIST